MKHGEVHNAVAAPGCCLQRGGGIVKTRKKPRNTESRQSDDAVSPVVGVMLMLVITIIIASVVSAFAGGIWGNADKAPDVSIRAEINVPQGNIPQNMTLTHLGGDPFLIKDVRLIVNNGSSSVVFTNSSVTAPLIKFAYTIDDSNGGNELIRPGDRFTGGNSTAVYFSRGQEYQWVLVHIPSQKTIATGKVYT